MAELTHLPWHWVVPQSITSEGFGWCTECHRPVPVDAPDAPLSPPATAPILRGESERLWHPHPPLVVWPFNLVRHLSLSMLGFGVFCGFALGVLCAVLVMR